MIIEEMIKEQEPRYSCQVLDEAKQLQIRKSQDYQNSTSTVKPADYYPRGVASIHDMMNTKLLRMKSIIDTMSANSAHEVNFESLEDSAIDIINYASFMVEYCRHKMPGQPSNRDLLNREV